MRILLIEDDAMIASGLQYALEQEGYQVRVGGSVADAREALGQGEFDLGILDLGLPDGSGFMLCELLRRRDVPVIILTAVDDEANTVRGLEMGADDYITKPFRLRELLARVQAVLRRQGRGQEREAGAIIEIGSDIQIHTRQAQVFRGGQEISLTSLEYRLLLALAEHRGQLLSRGQLLQQVWDMEGNFVEDNTLTVYIRRLRDKLGDDSQAPQLIKTVRGMGYCLD